MDNFQAQHYRLQERRAELALNEAKFWLYLAPLLAIVFLVINAAQAFWALSELAHLATDSTLNMVVTGGVALALILGANASHQACAVEYMGRNVQRPPKKPQPCPRSAWLPTRRVWILSLAPSDQLY